MSNTAAYILGVCTPFALLFIALAYEQVWEHFQAREYKKLREEYGKEYDNLSEGEKAEFRATDYYGNGGLFSERDRYIREQLRY